MILRLEVSSGSAHLSAPAVFRDAGGTIGRSEKCDCVLPDRFVSSFHARIHYQDGAFLIEDTKNRLVSEQRYPLTSGDLILIDPYELAVTIESAAQPRAGRTDANDPFAPDEQLDPIALIGGDPAKKKRQTNRAEDLQVPSPVNVQYRPPDPIVPDPTPPLGEIPDDWDLTGFGEKPRPESPAPIKPADPTPTPGIRTPSPGLREKLRATGELSDVLKGAGLPPDLVTPELAEDFGRIIRIIVSGLMDVLQARQQIKDEFGMQMTVFKSSRNNPLKFSANVEDALHNLLVKRNPAYLGPVSAFEDAFDDVLYHQMAMLAGMRAAFEEMLKSFSPDALQHEFEKHGKGSLISVPARMRYWDQYRAKYDDMVADTERCFEELFGQEFARAYDDQLERLKAEKRARGSTS
jgi:type VI secretion system FHA domain protein